VEEGTVVDEAVVGTTTVVDITGDGEEAVTGAGVTGAVVVEVSVQRPDLPKLSAVLTAVLQRFNRFAMDQKVNSALLKLTAVAAAKVNSGSCLLKLTANLVKLTTAVNFLVHSNPAVKVASVLGTAANFSLTCTAKK
jgi:hypothetical protein